MDGVIVDGVNAGLTLDDIDIAGGCGAAQGQINIMMLVAIEFEQAIRTDIADAAGLVFVYGRMATVAAGQLM